jgi:hypothetical protein
MYSHVPIPTKRINTKESATHPTTRERTPVFPFLLVIPYTERPIMRIKKSRAIVII